MSLRVLVVEDDIPYRELLKRWLESEGHQAVIAETLEAGFLGIASEPMPDAVLLDIHLGNKNGLTLVHWARKQRHLSHMPIAGITRSASPKDRKSTLDAGCDAHITKPIDFHLLRQFLASVAVHAAT